MGLLCAKCRCNFPCGAQWGSFLGYIVVHFDCMHAHILSFCHGLVHCINVTLLKFALLMQCEKDQEQTIKPRNGLGQKEMKSVSSIDLLVLSKH